MIGTKIFYGTICGTETLQLCRSSRRPLSSQIDVEKSQKTIMIKGYHIYGTTNYKIVI